MTEWLKVEPSRNTTYFVEDNDVKYFGELDDFKRPHGKGVLIYPTGAIHIGCWEYGEFASGNFIYVRWNGDLLVGERY